VTALLQDARLATSGTQSATVKVIFGLLALVMAFLIIFRRNGGTDK
jgi:hypothetical protein